MSDSERRIPSLDGLRALSILLVLCGHSLSTVPAALRPGPVLDIFLHNTLVAVALFFFLSGYLITRLLLKELDGSGRIDLRGFYLRRALRIFPVFYAYIAVMACLAAAGVVKIAGGQLLCASTFIWNYKQLFLGVGKDEAEWYFGHFWSLSLEEQFYLLWPLALLTLGIRRAAWACVGALLMLPWIRMGTQALVPSARPLMTMMFHTASDPIFAGCLLALAPRVWPDARWLRQPPGWWVAVAFGHLFLLAQWLRHWLGGYYFSTFGPTLEAASMWMLVTWLVANPGSAFGRVMNAPPITWIGRLSYSLYVWNQPFLTGLNRTWSGQFPLNLLCNVAVAWLSQQLLEKPFVRWRARLRTGDGSEGKR